MTARLEGVSVTLGGRNVLQDLNQEFTPGRPYVLRGPSGAGKTTLLNVLAGYVPVNSGKVTAPASRAYLIQEDLLFSELTAFENLAIIAWAKLNQVLTRSQGLAHLDELHVGSLVDTKVATLSGGERRRVELAALRLSEPELILVDEPTANLDVDNRRRVYEGLWNMHPGRILVVATHDAEIPWPSPDWTRLDLEDGRLRVS